MGAARLIDQSAQYGKQRRQSLRLVQNERPLELAQRVLNVASKYLQVRGLFKVEVAPIHKMTCQGRFSALARPQHDDCRELGSQFLEPRFGAAWDHP